MRAQTLPSWRWEHLIWIDEERQGCSKTVNALAAEAEGDWLFLLADDDLLLPGCLEKHLDHSEEADIVYSPPLVWGEDAGQFHLEPPSLPSTALIRKTLWEELGGYDDTYDRTEDRQFYEKAFYHRDPRARFVRFEYPCWVYRFHGANKSRQPSGADR